MRTCLALRIGLLVCLSAFFGCGSGSARESGPRLGFNVVQTENSRHGSETATRSLQAMAATGAREAAIVVFLWQPHTSSPLIRRGDDMSDDELRAGIRAMRGLSLQVTVKPHVWVPERWAGAIEMASEADWDAWFAAYREALVHIARIAAEEKAERLAIGTELRHASALPGWSALIAELRGIFPGRLTYFAHGPEEAERVAFWAALDAVGVTLYPTLGRDDEEEEWAARMSETVARLEAISHKAGKPVAVGEIGIRSAVGAAEKPWESAEEREAAAAPDLQARVLGRWLDALDQPFVESVLIWRWFTDPAAGGPGDTDFTVQGKPAAGVLQEHLVRRAR